MVTVLLEYLTDFPIRVSRSYVLVSDGREDTCLPLDYAIVAFPIHPAFYYLFAVY